MEFHQLLNPESCILNLPICILKGNSFYEQVGLLNPPILRKKSNATHQVICGYKRVLVLRKLGIPSLTSTIVPPEISDKKSLLLSLYDNISHREFNPIEKSMAIIKLQNYYTEEKIVHDFLPVLKLKPHITQLRAFKLLCKLEREIKDALLEGKISVHTSIQLSQMDRASRRALGKLLIALSLSVSKQAEILDYVLEIAIRENLPVEKVIGTSEIRSILENKKLNNPQKGESIRKYLRERRYPQLTEKEKQFTYNLKQLKFPPQITLRPPPFFEGDNYHLNLRFKNLNGLKQSLQKLESLLKNHSLLTIIEG